MNCKRIVTALAASCLLAVPAWAGSFGIYGSYWDSDQAKNSTGGGGRIGFNFVKMLELDFHGTYFSKFTTDVGGQSVDVKAKPVDGGLRVNLLPGVPINPSVRAGITYYFLDTRQGSIQNHAASYSKVVVTLSGADARL